MNKPFVVCTALMSHTPYIYFLLICKLNLWYDDIYHAQINK